MQNTRLNALIDGILGQFGGWFRNPWRRLSLLVISVLGGNFLATAVSTISGQKADLDIVVAALLVMFTELVSWLIYRGRPTGEGRSLGLETLNGLKLGLTYGLFVEAFKLGS